MDSTLQTTANSSISEQKYVTLRKRLDQLGYRQTLGIESLPLIEKLFNDLVHTTESLKKTKQEASKQADLNASLRSASQAGDAVSSGVPAALQAYKSDNAKLIKENNELHVQLIKVKDDFDQQIKGLKADVRKVEHENSDLRFLNTQYIHKLRAIEKESKDKSRKILELQEKNFQAVIQTPSGNKQPISFRRQRLDIDCMLPPAQPCLPAAILAANANDPYIIDMIKLADERLAQQQTDLETAKQAQEIAETKVSNYKNQIEQRDREIERLNRLFDGGRSFDVVSLEGTLRNNEKLIAHQNMQIEFLQDKNHQLEHRLQELMDAKREVINEKCRSEDMARVAQAADRQRGQAEFELNTLDATVHQLEIDKRKLFQELSDLKVDLDRRDNEIANLHALIDKIQDDKTMLTKKISKLLDNEKELVQELDGYKSGRRFGAGARNPASIKTSLTTKLDAHIKNIENERDFFKQEVDTLQKLLRSTQHEYHVRSFGAGVPAAGLPSGGMRRATSQVYNHKPRRENNGQLRAKSTSPVLQVSGGQTGCTVCCGKGQRDTSPPSPQRKPLVSTVNSDEVRQLRRERDELQALLDKFERHMAEIQANVHVLTSERDKFSQLYEENLDELQRTRRELLKSSKVTNASLATQAILKRVETERDTIAFDLRNAINERESLKERLRLTTETAIKEKASLEQQCEDLQMMLRNDDLDKKDLCQQIDLLQSQLEQLESKVHAQNYHLVQTNQDLNDQKSASTQMRIMAEEADHTAEDLRRQLSVKNEDLRNMEQANFRMEQKLIDMQEQNRSLRDEVSSLRMTIASLDKEKEKLLSNVEAKGVESATLKQELAAKHRRVDDLNAQLAQLDQALDRTEDELAARGKELTSLRISLDRTNEETGELARRYEATLRENKRFQEDLITMTRENQVLHCELDKANGDKEHLREQCTEYIAEVAKVEEIVNQKEQDRSNLLEQYRQISGEFNSMKITLNAFEHEAENNKIDLQMKHTENKRLRERLDIIEKDFQHQLNATQEYEVKLSSTNRNLQRLEEALKNSQLESKEILQDLMHCRDINARLEQTREDITRALNNKELDFEQLHNELADKRAENDLLRSQVNTERTMVKNLEDLIATNREKDYQLQLCTQERDAEIHLLKDRILVNEQKIQSQNKEISLFRSKLVEYETDNERLKRQLTNERFERERSAQELRKLSEAREDLVASSTRLCRTLSPPARTAILSTSPLGCAAGATCSTASAAIAAANAAVSASNAAILSSYRSISPVRSLSPSKELNGLSHANSTSNLRYSSSSSSSERRNLTASTTKIDDRQSRYIY